MSTQINTQMVDLDPSASAFLTAYIEAEQVKAALGDAEIGLVNGKEAVRWTTVESHRIDTKKIREMLPPEMVEKLEVLSVSRRFTIVDEY